MITYNHEKYIGQAIEGVLNQVVDFEVEFIISDDASSDRTSEIVKSYLKSHPKAYLMKYTRHSINKGMMANFIWALEKCKGEFIALCEGDDYWVDSLKLKKQISILESDSDIVGVFHNAEVISNLCKSFLCCDFLDSQIVSRELVIFKGGGLFPTASLLFRNILEIEELHNMKKYLSGDRALIYQLLVYGDIYYLNEVMSVYRVHEEGVYSQSYFDRDKSLNIYYSNIDLINDYELKFDDSYSKFFFNAKSYQLRRVMLKEKSGLTKIILNFKNLRIKDFYYLINNHLRD
ncbi:glycosyltransferase [Algoriphagus halophytocola]|uniref:Glycosyltransferase n=1 Tax=Algoriphagus halophytocola TaxID=2991499 RepID=A0ABY6MMN2_9BACT|nr:glycosyltransferase [Algoriphagus sp. TR-M5]UZD23941.1 glycosyltransferase [Algoriphagus sp. TR-M5]